MNSEAAMPTFRTELDATKIDLLTSDDESSTSTNDRPYVCPTPDCTSRFRRKYTLRQHLKTHTGEQPYQCTVVSCGRRFSTSGNLARHRRLHMKTNIRCPVLTCTRVFTAHAKLQRHLRAHMGRTAYPCCFRGCTKSFTTSGNLLRHQRKHHIGHPIPFRPTPSWSGHAHPPGFEHISRPAADVAFEPLAPQQQFYHMHHQQHQHQYQPDGISQNDIADLLGCLFDRVDGSTGAEASAASSRPNNPSHQVSV